MNLHETWSQFRAGLGIMHGSRAFGGPFQVELGLVNHCNIRCIHCYYHSAYLEKPSLRPVRRARLEGQPLPSREETDRIQALKADTERTNALLDTLIEMGTRRFQFSGNGEIFLHENAMEFLERTKRAGSKTWILTAGHMLDHDRMDALWRMKIDEMRMTLMAGTKDLYLRTHPGIRESTFDDITDSLLYLADRKRTSSSAKPILKLFYVVISENADGLMEFAQFASHVKADGVHFRPFDDVGDSGLARLIPTAEQALSVRRQLEEVQPYLEARGIKHNIGYFQRAFEKTLDTTVLYQHIPCYYLWLAVRIEADGELYTCCRASIPMGNVFEMPFQEIWHGEAYRNLRKEAHAINKRRIPVTGCTCHSCVNFAANLRVYQTLHPVGGRPRRIQELVPFES